MVLARGRFVAGSIIVLASTLQCRGATDARITAYSEIDCARNARVALVVAGDAASLRGVAPAAFSTKCAPAPAPFAGQNDTGTVVIAPSSNKDASFTIALMTRPDGESPESCIDPNEAPRCIIARRQLRYTPHEETSLAVELRLSCLGVVCPQEQTCRKGACVDARVPSSCADCAEDSLAPSTLPACGDMRGLQAGAPWPMPGFCPTRPGRSGRNGPRSPNIRWTFDTGGIAQMSPTVAADGTIYVGSNARTAFAVDPNGREKWRAPVASNINGSGFVIGADGTVYVGVGDGSIYAFDTNGARKWATPVGGDVALTPVAGGDGTIFVSGLAQRAPEPLVALGPSDGSIKWTSAPTFGFSAVAIGTDGTLFTGGSDAMLHALRSNDGSAVWTAPTAKRPGGTAVGDDGTVYAVDGQSLYAFTPKGEKAWELPLGADSSGVSLAADGTIYVADTGQRKLHAVAPDGKLRWTFEEGGPWPRPGVVGGDGTLYIGDVDGRLHAISPEGRVEWTATLGGALYSQPALGADGTLYIVSTDGNLYAIGP